VAHQTFTPLLISALLFFSTGCGLIPANPEVQPEFSVLYSQFLMDASRFKREIDPSGLVVQFGETAVRTDGQCTSPKTVTINRAYWDKFNKWGKELLLYHELGHCLLGQDHRPGSLMAEPAPSSTNYAFKREEYLTEFFSYSGNSSPQ
jgi:hypothetical protein